MDSLQNVETTFLPDIRSRIAKLPSPEKIAGMPKDELKELDKRIQHLINDISNASVLRSKKRDLRETLLKEMPPYRKSLLASKNWYNNYQNS